MRSPVLRHVLMIACMTVVSGCKTEAPRQYFVTNFLDMSDTKFTVQADAPPAVVRELAICKAAWFAEKMHKTSLSLTDPKYSEPATVAGVTNKVPSGWTRLTTTAYLAGPNPDGNPATLVADMAPACRAGFDWYR